jgi:hypothetical protein
MTAPVLNLFAPQVLVQVYKTIGRNTQVAGASLSQPYMQVSQPSSSGGLGGVIDLTPWLCDSGGVSTYKSVTEPAGGFTITLADKPLQAISLDTVYAAIEPMDYVEISMSYGNGDYPVIVMRGFVSSISRNEAMDDSGKPTRNVVISGQDYGKLWQLIQVFPLWARVTQSVSYLSHLQIFEQWGLGDPTVLSANAFVTAGITAAVNAMLAAILQPEMVIPRTVLTETIEGQGYNVSIQSVTAADSGTVYELLKRFADVGTWNELFMDDRPDGVYCVYRPYPAIQAGGTPAAGPFIRPIANPIDVFNIAYADVQAISVTRSDSNIANFYWVPAAAMDMVNAPQVAVALDPAQSPYMIQRDYGNCSAQLYGDRQMEAEALTFPATVTSGTSGQSKQEIETAQPEFISYVGNLQQYLALTNRDNVLFEQGTILIKGNPNVRAGTFVTIKRGSMQSSYYVRGVAHSFVPFASFTTTLTVERGTGFIDRISASAAQGAPYSAELY